ncbi:MAG: signal recognition particle-docking protein FtsY [Rhodobacteraceae bacterium]|nr:signal recognition particle-docking protein FtsY [Paracoccaceae bacterium]
MAFFRKLKDRLFKSSSKIEEGLDAIVEDGGEVAAPEEVVEAIDPAPAEPAPAPVEPAPTPDEPEQAPVEPAPTPIEPEHAQAPVEPESEPANVSPTPEAEPEAEPAPYDPVADQAEYDALMAELATVTPEQAAAAEAEMPWVDPEGEDSIDAFLDAELDEIETAIDKIASAKQSPEPEPEPQPQTEPEPAPEAQPQTESAPEPAAKPGFLGRLLGRKTAAPVMRRVLDDAMLESLEELLITADMGVDTALRVTANLAEGRMGRKMSTEEIKQALASEIARIMEPVARPLPIYPKTPQVVLVVGVNGSGKTTTIGKLASQFRAAGKQVVIAAGDTFRAAAVEQLQVWGDRAGVPVLTAPEGTDPASLAFDALTKAQADGADLLMIDTAGRLQNRADLMEELAKIVRVIRKIDPDAPHNTLLVLDATTGQNALSQVETFQKLSDVSGLVMTKLDGTAKGGVLVALADKFGLPIHAIGVGEQIDDLQPFDPEEFAAALTGLDVEG